ncbi:glycosyltransferase family 2 protein [Endozoicomonadaceae bacterium StTr2]
MPEASSKETDTDLTLSESAPLVSVIIPCYNHEDYIADAVNSVLNQTYSNIELIVINDGSTDQSGHMLDELSRHHPFTVIHQQNAGVSSAMNTGLAHARGTYIATLDSDDIFLPDKLFKQIEFLEKNPHIDICGGNMVIINETGELDLPRRFAPYREFDFEDVLLEKKDIIPASSALIKRHVIDKVGGYNPDVRVQDLYFWLKATYAGFRIAGLNDILIYYRKHQANNHNNYRAVTKDTLNIYQQYKAHPGYNQAKVRLIKGMFVKASKRDKDFAKTLRSEIPFKAYDKRVIKGLLRLLFS